MVGVTVTGAAAGAGGAAAFVPVVSGVAGGVAGAVAEDSPKKALRADRVTDSPRNVRPMVRIINAVAVYDVNFRIVVVAPP